MAIDVGKVESGRGSSCWKAGVVMGWIGGVQGSCVNAPMIAVADYSNGAEGYSYNYYVSAV